MPTRRPFPALLALVAAIALAGCSTPPPSAPSSGGGGATAAPLKALSRALTGKDALGYAAVFTQDFRFAFSSLADPGLFAQYEGHWGLGSEFGSARHLLSGYYDSHAVYHPPATNVAVTIVDDQYFVDPARPDSGAEYVLALVTRADLTVDVPNDSGRVLRSVASAPQAFWLVRGDVAKLEHSQPADAAHWYIRAWQDLAPSSQAGGTASGGVVPTTWGRLKAAFQ